MSSTAAARAPALPRWVLPVAALALCLLPLRHLEPEIEELERWRQMDTASYVLNFAAGPLDPLRPAVLWLGAHRTLVLECPLPELAAALVLRAADSRDLRLVRLVFWVLFLGAAAYCFLLAEQIAGSAAARWALLCFLSSPLVVLYARAIHIDLATLGLAFGMTYHYLRGCRTGSARQLLLGSALAVPAWLIKAPYVWMFWPLILVEARRQRRGRLLMRALPHVLLGPLAFLLWRGHAERTNAALPDWSFLPGYFRFVELSDWYFGTLADRFSAVWWSALAERIPVDAIGLGTLGVAAAAALVGGTRRPPGLGGALLWLGCAVANALLFFRLTAVHWYYLLPLVAPMALVAGSFLAAAVARLAERWGPRRATLVTLAALLALGSAGAHRVADLRYFRGQGRLAELAAPIRDTTGPGELVVTSAPWLSFASPLMLFPARRFGWAVPSAGLDAHVLDRLRCEGAAWLAYLESAPPPPALAARLADAPVRRFRAGRRHSLWLYDLRPLPPSGACPSAVPGPGTEALPDLAVRHRGRELVPGPVREEESPAFVPPARPA